MDLAGNNGAQGTSTTDLTSVTYDRTWYQLCLEVLIASNNIYDNSLAKVDDEIAITFTSSEMLQQPVVSIGGESATVTGTGSAGTSWTAFRDMTDIDTEGTVLFAIDFMDPSGNGGTRIMETTDASGITFDRTDPTMSEITIASNNSRYTDLAKVSDDVTITFTSSEQIQSLPTVTIDGLSGNVSGSIDS